MQEAQFSLCLIGIDHWNWTAYAFVDPGPASEDSVDGYHEAHTTKGLPPPDPLAAGRFPVYDPVKQCPREYFLKILEIRVKLIFREWHRAERWAEEQIKQYAIFSSVNRALILFEKASFYIQI